VVLAWTAAEAQASDFDLPAYRETAKRWIDKRTWLHAPPEPEEEAHG